MGLKGGINAYAYVQANPVIRYDFSGLYVNPGAPDPYPHCGRGPGSEMCRAGLVPPPPPKPPCGCDREKGPLAVWIGVAAGGSGGLIVYGGAKTAQMFNVLTGETCTLSITCRGFGLYIGESAGWTGELQVTSAWCGKGLAGWSFGLLGDLGVGCEILSGGVGGGSSGGEITGGSPVGCGAVAGAALYACETEVISCSNTPCECE